MIQHICLSGCEHFYIGYMKGNMVIVDTGHVISCPRIVMGDGPFRPVNPCIITKSSMRANLDTTPLGVTQIGRRLWGRSTVEEDFTYLGVPVIRGRRRKRHFIHVIHKLDQKLARWKMRLLSFPTWLTLAVLNAMPSFLFRNNDGSSSQSPFS